jgi:hypothetical protein
MHAVGLQGLDTKTRRQLSLILVYGAPGILPVASDVAKVSASKGPKALWAEPPLTTKTWSVWWGRDDTVTDDSHTVEA